MESAENGVGGPAKSTPKFLNMSQLDDGGFNPQAEIPCGVTLGHVRQALLEVYGFLHDVNGVLYEKGYDRLEELLLGNTFSGLLSELLVKSLARHSLLARNTKVGGHPDLIFPDVYEDNAVLKGDEGIEVKTSLQPGGWQGHNPETGWIMIFQYSYDAWTEPVEDREPLRFEKVMVAQLVDADWSFSGRKGTSRRTPTASILKAGTDQLHANFIYQRLGYVRRRLKR